MRKWSSTKPASPSVRWLRLLVASYQRDCYRPSHLPFGNNQRKNRLVVRCMFSCGIEPKWPGPRCREHKNRLHPRYGNFESTVCPWNNFNLSSPSLILNVFFLKQVYDKNAVLFLLCRSFSRVSAFNFYLLIQLLHWESSACTVQVRLVNVRKMQRIQRKKYRALQSRIFGYWEGYTANNISSRRLLKSCSRLEHGPVRTD